MNLRQSIGHRQVRAITDEWIDEYNIDRPHQSLGGLSPYRFAKLHENETSQISQGRKVKDINESLPLTSMTTI